MVATLGTPWEIDTTDTILVLEDADCRPYQVDRMLTHLRQSGKFDRIRGCVVGEMLGCTQHPDQKYTIEDVFRDALGRLEGAGSLSDFRPVMPLNPTPSSPSAYRPVSSLEQGAQFKLLESAVDR